MRISLCVFDSNVNNVRMLAEFVDTVRPNSDLQLALDVILEYKARESRREFMIYSCDTWARLEELQSLPKARIAGTHEEHPRVKYAREVRAECATDPNARAFYEKHGVVEAR